MWFKLKSQRYLKFKITLVVKKYYYVAHRMKKLTSSYKKTYTLDYVSVI